MTFDQSAAEPVIASMSHVWHIQNTSVHFDLKIKGMFDLNRQLEELNFKVLQFIMFQSSDEKPLLSIARSFKSFGKSPDNNAHAAV